MGKKAWLRCFSILFALAFWLSRTALVLACAVTGSSSYQPTFDQATTAFHNAGANNLGANYPSLPDLESGYPNQTLVPASAPCVLLKSIGYVESSWHQAAHFVPRGETGPTLATSGCGYGVMQITSDMDRPGRIDPAIQQRIAEEYIYNIAWGARVLIYKWNAAPEYRPVVGNRDPKVAENWYYAVWSYNSWVTDDDPFKNHPLNPNLPWPRAPFNGTQNRANYPYQELVWGLAANPPKVDDAVLWQPVDLTLPRREDIGIVPGWLQTPSPSHESPCQLLKVSSNSLSFLTEPGKNPDPQRIEIANVTGIPFSWKATASGGSWLSVSPTSGATEPATLTVSINAASLGAGNYSGSIVVEASNVAGSPQSVAVKLYVGPLRRLYVPDLPKAFESGR